MPVTRILTGGQTGADRGALDAAVAHGIPYAGWCPAGGWAEDHPDPPGLLTTYPSLRATATTDPARRTCLNARAADAVLVVRRPDIHSPGTDLTEAIATELERPLLVTDGTDLDAARAWLGSINISDVTLDVAGPRASEDPAAYDVTRALVERLLEA